MRKTVTLALLATSAAALAGCGSTGLLNRDRPDEFAVQRQAPLVVPPDFALTPPRPGEAESAGNQDPRAQALQALFGGPQPRSAVESSMLQLAHSERAALGARSVAGDPQTAVVSRGTLIQTILQLPQGDGQEAAISVPN